MMKKFYVFLMAVMTVVTLHAQSEGNRFVWLEDEGAFFEVNAFSDNKEFAVGRGMEKAFVYNLKTGQFKYLTEDGVYSAAWDVSDDGVVVGCYGEDLMAEACYWDKTGKMTLLAPEYGKWTIAKGITPSGNMIVGHSTNRDDDPEPQISHPFYWLLDEDNQYKMNPLQEITEEEFGLPFSGMFVRGVAANGTILAAVQSDNGDLPLVYYKSYSDKPVHFAKDSLKTYNRETYEYEGDQPFICCTGEQISQNGNWICCTVVKLVTEGSKLLQYYYPSAYSIAENKFYTSEVVLQIEREPAGGVVDDNGNMFSTVSGLDAMVGRTIVYIKKGEAGFAKIEEFLLDNGESSAPFKDAGANTIMTVSGDGKLVAGFALIDFRMGWIFDVDGTLKTPVMPTAITDVTRNIGLNCYLSGKTLELGNEVNEVALFSVSGEQVLAAKANGNNIDLSGLTPGVYAVKLISESMTSVSKVVVK